MLIEHAAACQHAQGCGSVRRRQSSRRPQVAGAHAGSARRRPLRHALCKHSFHEICRGASSGRRRSPLEGVICTATPARHILRTPAGRRRAALVPAVRSGGVFRYTLCKDRSREVFRGPCSSRRPAAAGTHAGGLRRRGGKAHRDVLGDALHVQLQQILQVQVLLHAKGGKRLRFELT